jgi:hypothetical protein
MIRLPRLPPEIVMTPAEVIHTHLLMNLNDQVRELRTKLDAQEDMTMALPGPVQSALDNFTSALAAALGTTPSTAAIPVLQVAPWWKPTATQTIAFAQRIGWAVADLDGNRQANNSPQAPKIVACDGTAADAMAYASFGFLPDGVRWMWSSSQRDTQRKLVDKLNDCGSPDAANLLVQGAGNLTTDFALFLVLLDQTTGTSVFGSVSFVEAQGYTDIQSWVTNYMSATPKGPAGPGVG